MWSRRDSGARARRAAEAGAVAGTKPAGPDAAAGGAPSAVAAGQLATLSPQRRRLVISGLLTVLLLGSLDSTVVSTALPTVVGELGGLDRLAWVVTGYLLAQTAVTPLYGKLGDLYGRKRVLQVAVVLFLAGSALCGTSGTMTQLVAFRALQGLGGGGLTVVTQAAVADVIPPRERGRYQGLFGAVFGGSSIAGPLIGGYFTTHLSWRWIFYVNLPLGAVALLAFTATFPAGGAGAQGRGHRTVDYAGAALLAAALSALTLGTDLGGRAYGWTSAPVLTLAVVAVAATAGFVRAERRATEPMLPLRLFRDRTFAVTAGVGLIVGFALFGSVTYLPLYLQGVQGVSPTSSGLRMLPMVGGVLVTSIVSGQWISRSGRYKTFPVVGTAAVTTGLALLAGLRVDTGAAAVSGMLLVLGLGLGMVMQVLVVAVQSAVAYPDLGAATSGATLAQLVGGSLGTAVLGAVFAAGLAAAGQSGVLGAGLTPAALAHLSSAERARAAVAVAGALSTVFGVAAGVAGAGFVLTWLLPNRPLRATVVGQGRGPGPDRLAGAPAEREVEWRRRA